MDQVVEKTGLELDRWQATTGRRVAAIFTSALAPGTGHLLLQRRRAALLWFAVPLVAMVLVTFFGPYAAAVVLLARVGAAIHATFARTGGPVPEPISKTIALMVLLVIGAEAVKTGIAKDVIENLAMDDGSMFPTLETGDLVVVDKAAYGQRLPLIGKVTSRPAKLGDLVAYTNPDKPDQLAVGRVLFIGPGTFKVEGGVPAGVARTAVEAPCVMVEVDRKAEKIVDVPCVRYAEQLAGVTWQTAQPAEGAAVAMESREIAAGSVVVAHDFRRGEKPWRVVSHEALKGRLKMIWFSTAGPRGIRWGRVGKMLPQ